MIKQSIKDKLGLTVSRHVGVSFVNNLEAVEWLEMAERIQGKAYIADCDDGGNPIQTDHYYLMIKKGAVSHRFYVPIAMIEIQNLDEIIGYVEHTLIANSHLS